MFDKKLLLQHIENRPRTVEEQSQKASQEESIERAASHIHDEWMKRNPKQDWNASQHAPYSKLPEEEKAKDREHVNHISNILTSNNLDPHNEEHHDKIIDEFGSIAHEQWRDSHREQRGNVPREKQTSDGETVDINVPYKKLHSEYKVENEAAGKAALDAFRRHMT